MISPLILTYLHQRSDEELLDLAKEINLESRKILEESGFTITYSREKDKNSED